HLKSINWSLSLGWAVGLPPEDLAEIKFRMKGEGIPQKAYYYGVKGRTDRGDFHVFDSAGVVGGKFNLGAMMLHACNYCDDIVGETADISIGDAWLPKYALDWRGKNMLVVRHPEITALLKAAQSEGRLELNSMHPKEAAKAQAGAFRQRREGLMYRIEKKRACGEMYPVKRAFPGLPRARLHRRIIYSLRERCASESRISFYLALQKGDFSIYTRRMRGQFRFLRFTEIVLSSAHILSVRIQRLVANWIK
ncbi:MAG: Coenzyme F420 hydrogenase/dehydrogenase, beta subunit C-terminal domain, partial [Acidobacteria bacterium]|nr:Coenzyme F420 hydrogenase/dehydrogenase, beta subunit C-terminal domain [Acidobacteriota bacterium]